jgi:5-dehydro-4-deoxyglucarate dehydratase
VGPVRRPLSDPSPEHLDRLAALIDRGLALLEELERSPNPA